MFRSMGLLFRRIPEGATLYAVAGVAVVEMAAVDLIVRPSHGDRVTSAPRIGLVLDDPKGFESAWRSFVPERPDFMHHV
jgi:hypothetical protein